MTQKRKNCPFSPLSMSDHVYNIVVMGTLITGFGRLTNSGHGGVGKSALTIQMIQGESRLKPKQPNFQYTRNRRVCLFYLQLWRSHKLLPRLVTNLRFLAYQVYPLFIIVFGSCAFSFPLPLAALEMRISLLIACRLFFGRVWAYNQWYVDDEQWWKSKGFGLTKISS